MNGVGFAIIFLTIGAFAGAVTFAVSWTSRRTARTEAATQDGFARAIASIRAQHDKLDDAAGAFHHEQRRTRGD